MLPLSSVDRAEEKEMAFTTISIHETTKITAKATSVNDTHWIDLHFGGGIRIGVFFDTAEVARGYAEAINGVPVPEPAELEAAE
jgi:hypothetical protein